MAKTWVYLMTDARTGFVKIGRSDMPRFREKTLQAEVPLVEIREAWYVNAGAERLLHRKYSHLRLRGEWFRLDYEEIYEIEAMFADAKRLTKPTSLNEERQLIREEDAREAFKEAVDRSAFWRPEDLGFSGDALDFAIEGFGIEI